MTTAREKSESSHPDQESDQLLQGLAGRRHEDRHSSGRGPRAVLGARQVTTPVDRFVPHCFCLSQHVDSSCASRGYWCLAWS
jgi:hypothetical protein